MPPCHVTRFLVSALFVLVFAPLPRYEVDALFFGSNSEKKEEEHKINEASEEAHDLPHLSPIQDDDLTVGGEDFDVKAFLGSQTEADEYAKIPKEDQILGLKKLFPKIDEDGNGNISKPELIKWITNSLMKLKKEEAEKRFPDHDYDSDGKFSWKDHVYSVYGSDVTDEEIKNGVPGIEGEEEDYKEQLELFRVADVDKNNEISWDEFGAFFRPEDFPHTQEFEIKKILKSYDADKNGGLDLQEFLKAELHELDDPEWVKIETERFHKNWDADGDGLLKGVEIRAWWMPNNEEIAKEEVEHLFGVADADADATLSLEEVVDNLETFVGSQATNYGVHIEDELW